jgi:hypothetical protein
MNFSVVFSNSLDVPIAGDGKHDTKMIYLPAGHNNVNAVFVGFSLILADLNARMQTEPPTGQVK